MQTKFYALANSFRTVKLATSRFGCFVNSGEVIYRVERKEAANAIRYARATNGKVSTIK
jgi:hypothetical protein